MNGSPWTDWLACGLVAVAPVLPGQRGQRLIAGIGLGAVAVAYGAGSSGEWLLPVAAGGMAAFAMGSASKWRRWLGGLAALGGAAATLILGWALPRPELPAWQGPHRVGTFSFEIPEDGKAPRLVVQAWYPTDAAGESRWLADEGLASRFPFHRMARAIVPIGVGVPPLATPAKFPVILYEHSWTGHRAENTAQVSDLASRGFVVIAIDHPGQAARIRYADGSVVTTRLPGAPDFSTAAKVAEFLSLGEECFAERERNLARVLAALESPLADGLTGRLDFGRVGVFGFSFGGSHALRLCARDPRFKAGANEDGLYFPGEAPPGPFLFFDSELPGWLASPVAVDESAEQTLIRQAEARLQAALAPPFRRRVVINGVSHTGFSDAIFRSPWPRLSKTGTQPAAKVHETICKELGEFFEASLAPRP
jgi:hypothetical protein